MKCFDCPRKCGVDRSKDLGFCGEKNKIKVAKIIKNFMWEEPCISGKKGALAIFFSGCNLKCKYCQNYQISFSSKGKECSPDEFAALLKSFDLKNFSCIDLITPTHFSSLLVEALQKIKSPIPVVWNSSGYENAETIKKVARVVDVFLVDFKYYDKKLSKELSSCPDYFAVASKVVPLMTKLKKNKFKRVGGVKIMVEGVLIRHLILPGHTRDSKKVLTFIAKNIDKPFVSIMSQFTPTKMSPLRRKLYPLEAKATLAYAQRIGLRNGYCQELDSSCETFIPNFD